MSLAALGKLWRSLLQEYSEDTVRSWSAVKDDYRVWMRKPKAETGKAVIMIITTTLNVDRTHRIQLASFQSIKTIPEENSLSDSRRGYLPP